MNLDQLKEWQKCGREVLSAQTIPETLNAEDRTVDVVWFTGVDVPRMNFWTGEPYILRFDPKGVDLSNLNSGAPLLDDHNDFDGVEGQKGVVSKAWVDGTNYLATLRFSRRPDVDGIWQDVQDKIIQKFSMGTEILEKQDISAKGDKMKTFVATKWRPYEISMAPIPADFGTTTLSAIEDGIPSPETETTSGAPAQLSKETEHTMSEELKTSVADAPAPPVVDEAKLRQDAVNEERARAKEIRSRVATAKLSAELADQLIDQNVSVELASTKIFEALAKQPSEQPETMTGMRISHDEGDKLRETMSATLLHRYEPVRYKAQADAGREWMGYSLMEMSREILRRKSTPLAGKGPDEVANLALTTSDFPNILADVANKTLRAGYENYPNTFQTFTRRTTARDFKNINRVQLSGAPAMLQVNEHGEIKQGYLTDSKETYAIASYARILNVTRKTLINDDLGALTRIPEMMGRKAAILEGDIVWKLVTANGNMADGFALFSSDHKNLAGTPAVMNVDTIGSAASAMTLQTGLEGDTLNLNPKYLATSINERLTVQKLLTPVSAILTVTSGTPAVNAVPGWVQSLVPIFEPRLDAYDNNAWWLFADPSQIDTIEYCYLEGQEGMYFETQMGFEIDGLKFKARHDFGAGVIDYRGMYKNAGA